MHQSFSGGPGSSFGTLIAFNSDAINLGPLHGVSQTYVGDTNNVDNVPEQQGRVFRLSLDVSGERFPAGSNVELMTNFGDGTQGTKVIPNGIDFFLNFKVEHKYDDTAFDSPFEFLASLVALPPSRASDGDGALPNVAVSGTTKITIKYAVTVQAGRDSAFIANGVAGNDYMLLSHFNDVVDGRAGHDILVGNRGDDRLSGGIGDDSLDGKDGADRLNGGAGADALFGGRGLDTLDGGAGSDTAGFQETTKAVVLTLKGAAFTSVKVGGVAEGTLRNIENVIGGSGNDLITGDALANVLEGDAGNDTVNGGGGADTLIAASGAGNDRYNGGTGIDTIVFASAAKPVRVNLGAASNHATGAEIGADRIAGVENVVGGSGNDTITGNALANALTGGNGVDTLKGMGGNDLLGGGAGKDVLTGGLGNDLFLFNTALNRLTNIDRITDFNVAADTIRLDNDVFKALTKTGVLAAGAFNTGATATEANDRIIYNEATGALLYDANGRGGLPAIQFATLGKNLLLTNADFVVV